ncbi:MAG: DNA gyrase inhibitor YacG, partial [Terriglobales bacterium]
TQKCFPLAICRHISTMPRKRSIKLRCPICKKLVQSADADFPFCSDRCRLIDLGKWASGAYVISSPVDDAEQAIRQDIPDEDDSQ